MATWRRLFWEEPQNVFERARKWRSKNVEDTKAGYLLTKPNRIAPATFEEAIYTNPALRDRIIKAFEVRGLGGLLNGKKGRRLTDVDLNNRIVELLDPKDTRINKIFRPKFNDEIDNIRKAWEKNFPAARANRRWENAKKLPFTDLRYNTDLAKQNFSKLSKGLKIGSIIDLLALANDLRRSQDKQGAFENFIGYRADDPNSDNKYFHLGDYVLGTGIGAGIGGLASYLTGTGLISGAAAGALGTVAPMASLAGGYWLGSKLDEATGASDKIASFARDYFYDEDEEKAKLLKADEAARNDPEVKKAWEFLRARNALMQEKGISKQAASAFLNRAENEKAVREYAGKFIEGMLGANKAAPETTTAVAQNNTVPENTNTVTPRVDYLDKVSNPQVASVNATLPNSRLRVYDPNGNFIRYI